ncbi:glycosyl hydrolase family 95 catalytic domain-containing protein [Shivajiella indica]|uniref:Glycoside hydrolase N-terminal domain-containing protein n=1 Tax=Shivajiella indica TaxID=872115 RepID=A0ABW5BFT5_9BACT
MKSLKYSWILTLILVQQSFAGLAQKSLWYKQPANAWEEALPIGNGRLGAMVFGRTEKERIQLNEDSLWPGGPDDWDLAVGKRSDLEEIRTLLNIGENKKADSLLVAKFSRKSITRSHQTLGDLWIDLGHKNISNYKRELSLDSALATVSYEVDGFPFSQKVFSSSPSQAIIVELKTLHPNGINGTVRLSRPEDDGHPTVTVKTTSNQTLQMDGEVTQRRGMIDSKPSPILHGVRFQTIAWIENEGGNLKANNEGIILENVKNMTIKMVTNTSYYHPDFRGENQKLLQAIQGKTFEELLEEHVNDYQSLFKRLEFKLGEISENNVPTDKRIQNVQEGKEDLFLETLLFDFGRYLLISSSRPGTLPANLQGIWNEHIEAPWNADYHMNINLQMNYWPAEVTNLSELHEPLFNYMDKLIISGKLTAAETYGMKGAALAHGSDLWHMTFLQAAQAYWGAWIGAGGWMMQHFWERYLFTGDKEFLEKRFMPAMTEIAQFYSDWLVRYPEDGLWVSSPSTSPENSFINLKGESVASTMGAAMDQQIIAEVFDNYISACEILQIQPDLLYEIKAKRENLRSGLWVGQDGRLLEWDRPYEEPEKGHRHMSHLYAFHPGNAISRTRTPELFDAVRKTLDYRLANGGAGTGWSRAWLINFSARLHDGEMAHENIKKLIQISLYPNLFDAHPPFQIDGNFGYTAGIAEMLLQSHDGFIHLLPALPKAWEKGSIKGLKARGNYTLDISWENGELSNASVFSQLGGKVIIKYQSNEIDLELGKGERFELELK